MGVLWQLQAQMRPCDFGMSLNPQQQHQTKNMSPTLLLNLTVSVEDEGLCKLGSQYLIAFPTLTFVLN
jgi:hypothetical protein